VTGWAFESRGQCGSAVGTPCKYRDHLLADAKGLRADRVRVAHCEQKALSSQLYETFAEDWRLGRIVDKLRKVNPDFFPVPMSAPYEGLSRQLLKFESGGSSLVVLYDR